MQPLPMSVPVRFCPSKETLNVLNSRPWICSYSGGKDSTTLVTWIEYLRRVGMANVKTPRLVLADTGVEYPFLGNVSSAMMEILRGCGWSCDVVKPPVEQRLYVRIFGIGVTPVHPSGNKMRWCTRSTKIDPMRRYAQSIDTSTIMLSGVRYGESANRDSKLKPQGCAAGGECGLPPPRDDVYAPIIDWRTCKVLEWINGDVDQSVRDTIPDLIPLMSRLHAIYEVKTEPQRMMFDVPPKSTAMRFGCVGCPAVNSDKVLKSKRAQRENLGPLGRIYAIWKQCYLYENRCVRVKDSERTRPGPLRMEARQRLYAELLEIQLAAGVVLVNDEEDDFIRKCWVERRYPRGWSELDEATVEPGFLFDREPTEEGKS